MRLFLAIEIPDDERQRLAGLSRRREWFGFEGGYLRWVRPENLHVTLKFFGEVPDGRVPELIDALAGMSLLGPLQLRAEGFGFFPPRGAVRVFYAELAGDVDALRRIHAEVESVVEPLGFPREARAFTPHVTLARAGRDRPAKVRRELIAQHPVPPGEPFLVRSLTLFESRLKPGGPEYIPAAHFPLDGPPG